MVQITSMGRPETIFLPQNTSVFMDRYPDVFGKVREVMKAPTEIVRKRVGVDELLPAEQKPITILPSASCLVEAIPGPEAIFTGPFLPLPGLVEEQGRLRRRLSSFNMQLSGAPGLLEWLSNGDPTKPVIYVAL